MRNKYLLLIVLLLSAIACKKSYLIQPPQDQLTSEAYYQNVAQINTGVIGCYPPLQDIYNGGNLAWTLGVISDDIAYYNYGQDPLDLFYKDYSYSISWLWTSGYNDIQRCNRMIQVINAGAYTIQPGQTALLNSYLGEAKFIRALNYFNLVRMYGDVPLVTVPFDNASDAINFGRTPISTIYDSLIIPDLQFAAQNCLLKSQTTQLGRVTSGAAYTILGKVYLTLKRYALAEAALKQVINSAQYSLMPTVAGVVDTKNENNKESIFEIQYDQSLGNGSAYNHWCGWTIGTIAAVNNTPSNQSIVVDTSLINLYKNTNDTLRYKTWVFESVKNASGTLVTEPFPLKLITLQQGALNQNNNFIVTRYADVVLMYEEAMIMQNPNRASEGLADINTIRTRAGMPVYQASDITLDVLLNERRVELSFEGHRWFDLVRTGKAMTAMQAAHKGLNIPAFQFLFPIPLSEIQKNTSLTQTPGY